MKRVLIALGILGLLMLLPALPFLPATLAVGIGSLIPPERPNVRPEDLRLTVSHPASEAEARHRENVRQLEKTGLSVSAAYRPPAPGPAPANCILPRPAANDLVVVYGTYVGGGVASVAVSGLDDETHAARVVIEGGSRPIYLVLSTFDPVIFVLEGDTRRIAHVVLLSGRPAPRANVAAVTGVAPSKVTFVPPRGCFNAFTDIDDGLGRAALGAVSRALGRLPDVFAGAYETVGIALPSAVALRAEGKTADLPRGFDELEWRHALAGNRAGLFTIDPKAVVAAATPQAYDVLPGEVGLAQLVGQGTLLAMGGTYLVKRPIPRYPADLRSSVKFRAADNVLLPPDPPGR